jgi:uncharacterized protein YaaR (DUF327 family)
MDDDAANDIMWEDQENFKSAGSNSIKDIALESFRRCRDEGSKEMTRGGMIKRVMNGQIIELPKPDQIQIFTNCVEMLMIILRAHAEQHHELMRPYYLRFFKGKRDIESIREIKRKEFSSCVNPGRWTTHTERMMSVQSQINDHEARLNEWYDTQYLRLYKEMFEGLGLLLNKLNYFQEADYSAIQEMNEASKKTYRALDEETLLNDGKPSA